METNLPRGPSPSAASADPNPISDGPSVIAALVPATIVLLGVEMKLLSGRMQADLWTFPAAGGDARR